MIKARQRALPFQDAALRAGRPEPHGPCSREARPYEVWVDTHPLETMRPALDRLGFTPCLRLPALSTGALVRVAGLLVTVHTPPTRSGRRVMFITIEDETGLMDLVAFEDVQKSWAGAIFTSPVLFAEGVLKKEGRDGRALSITMKRLLRPPVP